MWSRAITRLPAREKLGTALNLSRGLVLATTGGYVGDAPPYQGHVAAIDARTGRLVHVWNALCSDRHALIVPSSCSESGAAIWARSGVVVMPGGRLLVATGDGKFDGRRHWGDTVAMLSSNAARLLQNWTPTDAARLETQDVDLGSTAPALVSSGLAVQSGKDAKLRLAALCAGCCYPPRGGRSCGFRASASLALKRFCCLPARTPCWVWSRTPCAC